MANADPNARLKLWLQFWRIVFISGVVGAFAIFVPPWINARIQDKELDITKEQKGAELALARNKSDAELAMAKSVKEAEILEKRMALEQNYVTTFLERATEENVENRYRFTRYLSALTRDPELKAGWAILFSDAEKERSEKKQRLEELEGKTDEKAKAEIATLQSELEATRRRRYEISIVPTSLLEMQKNAPCPENSKPRISAIEFETPDLAYDEDTGGSSIKTLSRFTRPLGTRTFNIVRWCITGNDEIVGNVVAFGPAGEALLLLPRSAIPQ
ncbi:MAG: hypothetical protein IIA00_06300 [Proteobacteria bacterium]|nr:hypothetical protein [Pseudomonadota bacterium]